MTKPAEVKKTVRCTICLRGSDVGNWSCDLWNGKAYCPLCDEESPLLELLKKAGMTAKDSRAMIQPAPTRPKPRKA